MSGHWKPSGDHADIKLNAKTVGCRHRRKCLTLRTIWRARRDSNSRSHIAKTIHRFCLQFSNHVLD